MFYTTDAASFKLLQEVLKALKRLGGVSAVRGSCYHFVPLHVPYSIRAHFSGRSCCLSRERDRVTLHLLPCTWCDRAPGAVHMVW
jgi:hypothetical protein